MPRRHDDPLNPDHRATAGIRAEPRRRLNLLDIRAPLAAAILALPACIPAVEPPYRPPPPAPARPRPAPPVTRQAPGPPLDDWTPPPAPAREPRRRPAPTPPVAALPAPRPAWEARTVVADAPAVAAQTATVRHGDTLSRVAERSGAGADAIAFANGLAPPFTVRVGQRLAIPGGRYHLVRPGETGIAIARAYAVEWSRIVAANGLAEPFILRAGQRVLIPGADRPRTAAERAAAFTLDIDDILTGGEPAATPEQKPAAPVRSAARVLPPTAVVAEPARLTSRFAWPVEGDVVRRFGAGASGDRSAGINIAVPPGTTVRAAGDGVVAYVGTGIASLGGLVLVKHGDGWVSVYGYASKLLVRRGQAVKQGQPLALSGESGSAERPELHFELRKGRTPVDPVSQLPRQ